jgi:hypothetical protein
VIDDRPGYKDTGIASSPYSPTQVHIFLVHEEIVVNPAELIEHPALDECSAT